MGRKILETTVIGSYPARPSNTELMAAFFHTCGKHEDDPYRGSIQAAIEAQAQAGIDTLSDGQTRDGMVELFVKRLGGTRLHGRSKIVDGIEYLGPITLPDLEFARSLVPGGRSLKGLLTGPYTLACSCIDEHYGDIQEAAFAFARALNREARAIQHVVDVVQVDEPFFTDDYPEYGRELVSAVLEGVENRTALHVCGDVSSIFSELVEFPVDVLAHEFANNPQLLDVVKDIDFSQILCYGSVLSHREEIETVERIMDHVYRALEFFSPDKMVLSPDCGLRHQLPETAYGKLRNLVRARDNIIESEGW